MNNYAIPIIEPSIDYTKVPPINQKRTISFVNHFIVHTVTFLNKFAMSCEEKLFELENKLQRAEALLEILESRLSSIPGLEQDIKQQQEKDTEQSAIPNKTEEAVVPKIDEPDDGNSQEPTVQETNPVESFEYNSLYQKYFKMVQFGVPKQAVKLKMKQEGLDPSILDSESQQISSQNKLEEMDSKRN